MNASDGKSPEDRDRDRAGYQVALSGGSGMLGTALKQALAARHTPVLQLVRREPSAPGQLRWDPAKPLAVADQAALEGALEGLTAVVHLSGASVAGHRWTPAYKREMWTSRVASTRALATMLAQLRTPPQGMIVASAVGIYGDRGGEILDESSEAGMGFLANLCKEWEIAAQPAVQAGIRVVHARFGVVLGQGEGALGKMLPLFKLGLGGRLGSGRQWMSWVSLQDVVGALLFAMESQQLTGAMNVTSPNPVTNEEFTQALAHAVHRPAVLPAPAFALRLAMGEMADEALLASARAIPAKLTEEGFQFAHAQLGDALAAVL